MYTFWQFRILSDIYLVKLMNWKGAKAVNFTHPCYTHSFSNWHKTPENAFNTLTFILFYFSWTPFPPLSFFIKCPVQSIGSHYNFHLSYFEVLAWHTKDSPYLHGTCWLLRPKHMCGVTHTHGNEWEEAERALFRCRASAGSWSHSVGCHGAGPLRLLHNKWSRSKGSC